MRIIVAGSRDFEDYEFLARVMKRMTVKLDRKRLVIINGGAKGADLIAQNWAYYAGIPCETFHPDWAKHHKAAGPIRNQEMVDSCRPGDGVVAFHKGDSPGTADLIRRARKAGLKVKVIQIKGGKDGGAVQKVSAQKPRRVGRPGRGC